MTELRRTHDMYCGHCGTKMIEGVGCPRCAPVDVLLPGHDDDAPSITGALVMYGLLLGLSAVLLLTVLYAGPHTPDEMVRLELWYSIASAVLVAGTSVYYRSWVLPRMKWPAAKWFAYAPAMSAVTIALVLVLMWLAGADGAVYRDSHYGLAMQLVLMSVMPPLFEELAFRGVIFASLERVMKQRECIIVTAFMFAILHLSILSLPWLVLAGVFFGWLRSKSGSIWPGVLAHALHNLVISLIDWYA